MSRDWRAASLAMPVLVIIVGLLVLPLGNVLQESFRLFSPGGVGSASDAPFTLRNYTELWDPAYFLYFSDTMRISFISSLAGLAIGYPIAYRIARMQSGALRSLWIGFLIVMLFLSVLVRVYAVVITFGPTGFQRDIARLFDLNPNGATMTELLVVIGLLHYMIPVAAITLIGTIQNINPRLVEAAQALGAAQWRAHLSVTLPLSMRGVLAAFLLCYTLSISAFVIPLILGKGRVLFISNLIYSRFGQVANYPSGAALSIVLLSLSLLIIFLVSVLVNRRWQ